MKRYEICFTNGLSRTISSERDIEKFDKFMVKGASCTELEDSNLIIMRDNIAFVEKFGKE